MAVRREVEKTVHLREFQRNVDQLLMPEDKDYLFYAMKEFNTYKSVAKLMLALNSCLDTPEKLDLLPYIRDLIPKHDRKRFDNLAPYNRMARPFLANDETAADSSKSQHTNSTTEPQQQPNTSRIITLQRSPGKTLGFSIRGGREHDLGIFVSHVDLFSLAEKNGLQVGDQIISVNGIIFDRVSHSSAVLVLKAHDNLTVEVQNIGRVPGQKLGRNSFIWVDPTGNPIEEVQETVTPQAAGQMIEGEHSGNRLLGSVDKHKVVLHSESQRALGFSVRGGSEYGLGIYISLVEKGSPSEEAGLQVGDQILDINGHSFVTIFHQEAVHILRSYPTLIMTIKSLGRLPTLAPMDSNTEGAQGQGSFRKISNQFKSSTVPRKMSSSHSQTGAGSTSNRHRLRTENSGSENGEKARVANVKRSQSERKADPEPYDAVDGGGSDGSKRSNLSGSHSVTLRRKPMVVSPLATHENRASSASTFTSPTSVTQKFFERGMGTQVMLASSSSQAKQLLFDHVRRVLNEDDIITLTQSIKKYEDDEDIHSLVRDVIPILDTPEEIQLLTDIRSVLKPTHIVVFDKLVSPYEVKTLQKKDSESEGQAKQYGQMFEPCKRATRPPDLGAFGSSPAQSVLAKALPVATDDLNLSGLQTRESFLAWYEEDSQKNNTNIGDTTRGRTRADDIEVLTDRKIVTSQPTPVSVEIKKDSSFLGLALKGGVDTPLYNVYVRELRKGGAIDRDGFIKPGYEIIQVDNERIKGKTYTQAVETIAKAYSSADTMIKFIVIPTQLQH